MSRRFVTVALPLSLTVSAWSWYGLYLFVIHIKGDVLMKKVLLLLFSVLCTVASFGQTRVTYSAGQLLQDCKVVPDTNTTLVDAYGTRHCQGFVRGWLEGAQGMETTLDNGKVFTVQFPDDLTIGQTVRVFVLYMAKHPEMENKSPAEALCPALTDVGLLTFVPKVRISAPVVSSH